MLILRTSEELASVTKKYSNWKHTANRRSVKMLPKHTEHPLKTKCCIIHKLVLLNDFMSAKGQTRK